MIQQIETAILAQINAKKAEKAALSKMVVESLPENPEKRLMPHATGSVWVHFAGLDSNDPEGINFYKQKDTYLFDINIVTRNLRPTRENAAENLYTAMQEVRTILTGFAPLTASKKMYMKSSKLISDGEFGFWQYAMRFAVQANFILSEPEETNVPVTKVTFTSENRETTIEG